MYLWWKKLPIFSCLDYASISCVVLLHLYSTSWFSWHQVWLIDEHNDSKSELCRPTFWTSTVILEKVTKINSLVQQKGCLLSNQIYCFFLLIHWGMWPSAYWCSARVLVSAHSQHSPVINNERSNLAILEIMRRCAWPLFHNVREEDEIRKRAKRRIEC